MMIASNSPDKAVVSDDVGGTILDAVLGFDDYVSQKDAFAAYLSEGDIYGNVYLNGDGILEMGSADEDMGSTWIDMFDFV